MKRKGLTVILGLFAVLVAGCPTGPGRVPDFDYAADVVQEPDGSWSARVFVRNQNVSVVTFQLFKQNAAGNYFPVNAEYTTRFGVNENVTLTETDTTYNSYPVYWYEGGYYVYNPSYYYYYPLPYSYLRTVHPVLTNIQITVSEMEIIGGDGSYLFAVFTDLSEGQYVIRITGRTDETPSRQMPVAEAVLPLVPSGGEVDTTPPVITILGNNPDSVFVGSGAYPHLGATAFDNMDGDVSVDITYISTVNTDVVGTYMITYSVADSAGNVASAVRTVNVVAKLDVNPPVITVLGANPLTVEVLSGPYIDPGAQAADMEDGDLSGKIVTDSQVDMTTVGVYLVVYKVRDFTGNTDVKTRTVHVIDTTPPVITILGNNPDQVFVGSGPYPHAGATAFDKYDGDLSGSIQVTSNVNTDVIGVYLITYTVPDSSGNVGTAVRTVNVVAKPASNPPVITITGANPLTTEVLSGPYIDPGAQAADVEDGDLSGQIQTVSTVNMTVTGTYTVIYTVSDSDGKMDAKVRTVHVVDTTSPVITILGNNPDSVFVGSGPYLHAGATAFDAYNGDLSAFISVNSTVNTDVIDVYTITYIVPDSSGNVGTAVRTVNVVSKPDVNPPVITILGANPLTTEVLESYDDPGATATDIEDGDLTSRIEADIQVDTTKTGTYLVIYTVKDNAGNMDTKVRTVHIVDSTPPAIDSSVVSLVNLMTREIMTLILSGQDNYDPAPVWSVSGWNHNLASVTLIGNELTVAAENLTGQTIINLRLMDSSGNVATKEIKVAVSCNGPSIVFTHVPEFGNLNDTFLVGSVSCVDAVNTRIVVYIKVIDDAGTPRWWIKPDFGSAAYTAIGENLNWSCLVVTGGRDEEAREFLAFLVEAGTPVPLGDGMTERPTVPEALTLFSVERSPL